MLLSQGASCSRAGVTGAGRRQQQLRAQAPSRRQLIAPRASLGGDSNGASLPEGASVKVVAEVKVFHAPKHPDGLDLQGKVGTVVKNVMEFKGKVLSPNLPYKVQFGIPKDDGTQAKLFVHLEADELELVS